MCRCDPQYATRPRTEGEFTSQAAPPRTPSSTEAAVSEPASALRNQGLFISTKYGNYCLADVRHGPAESSRASHCLAVGQGTSPTPSADRLTHSGQGGLRLPFPPSQSCGAARARTPWGSKPSSERHTAELGRCTALHLRRHVPTQAQACLCGSHPSAQSGC